MTVGYRRCNQTQIQLQSQAADIDQRALSPPFLSEANGALDVGYTQRCIDEAQRGPRNSKPTDKVAAAAAAKVARKPFTDITKNAAAAANDDDRAAELKARAGSAWGGLKSWGSGLADKVKDLRVDNDGGDLGNFLASNRSTLGSGKEMAGLGSTGFGSDALSRPAHARHDSSNFGSDGFMTADDGGSFGRSSSQNSFSNASRTSSGNALDEFLAHASATIDCLERARDPSDAYGALSDMMAYLQEYRSRGRVNNNAYERAQNRGYDNTPLKRACTWPRGAPSHCPPPPRGLPRGPPLADFEAAAWPGTPRPPHGYPPVSGGCFEAMRRAPRVAQSTYYARRAPTRRVPRNRPEFGSSMYMGADVFPHEDYYDGYDSRDAENIEDYRFDHNY